jgi:hypothetical protein
MAYLATQELQFKLDDGSYCVVPAGRALPPKFPEMIPTLAALQRAKLVSIVPDEAVEPFELVPVPTRTKIPAKGSADVTSEEVDVIAAEMQAAQAESAERVARRNARLAATEPKPTRKGRRTRK